MDNADDAGILCRVIRATLIFILGLWVTSSWASDPLNSMGLTATTGAADGYLDDAACSRCHRQKFESYQAVGMSQSLRRPENSRPMERFGESFFHAPSHNYYAIVKEGDSLIFERHQRDRQGEKINALTLPISWVMGSGNRARSYLYQTQWGELYQLPLGWYSEDSKWEMSPGFEFADHPGVHRRVPRECMFCHNAFPDVADESDDFLGPDRFPDELPEGTGCQRCHGPGAEHVRSVLRGDPADTIRAHVVNPAKLTPARRDSVCFQCHMLPSVAVPGARRFDRDLYSFRPGQLISDYLVHVNATQQGLEDNERFEINHHGYRMWSSACYQRSGGELGCISCHDPHRKPDSTTFRAEVSDVCGECHEAPDHSAQLDGVRTCVDCHMPTRRTRDVVHVTMTDHRIARGPFDFDALVLPLEKKAPVITGVEILNPDLALGREERMTYRTVPALRVGVSVDSAAQAHDAIWPNASSVPLIPGYERINAALAQRDFSRAEGLASSLLDQYSEEPLLWTVHGVALLGLGDAEAAEESLRRSSRLLATPESEYNLGLALYLQKKTEQALGSFERAIDMRPIMTNAWKYRALCQSALGKREDARNAWKRALELSPARADLYRGMVEILRSLEDMKTAQRYLDHGRAVVANPRELTDLYCDEFECSAR